MLTGKFEFRQSIFGNIKIYVEDEVSWGWDDPADTRLYKRMRKATKKETNEILNKITLNRVISKFVR